MPIPSNSRRANRLFLSLALAIALLTIVPAVSSLIVISSAWSNRSDAPARRGGGMTVVQKNGDTPRWMADILEQAPNTHETGIADTSIDPRKGLSI